MSNVYGGKFANDVELEKSKFKQFLSQDETNRFGLH